MATGAQHSVERPAAAGCKLSALWRVPCTVPSYRHSAKLQACALLQATNVVPSTVSSTVLICKRCVPLCAAKAVCHCAPQSAKHESLSTRQEHAMVQHRMPLCGANRLTQAPEKQIPEIVKRHHPATARWHSSAAQCQAQCPAASTARRHSAAASVVSCLQAQTSTSTSVGCLQAQTLTTRSESTG
jgi:hypothetical protein